MGHTKRSTLVCVIGETRGASATWRAFKSNVLEALDADLALCIGVNSEYDYSNPFWQHAIYRWCVNEQFDFASQIDTLAERLLGVKKRKNWRQLIRDGGGFMFGGLCKLGGNTEWAHASGGILLYFRHVLKQKIEENSICSKYDWVIVTRSDYMWNMAHPRVHFRGERKIWIPDGEQYGGFTDRHAVLPTELVAQYLGVLESMVHHQAYYSEMLRRNPGNSNLETLIKLHLNFFGLSESIGMFPYCMYTVRAPGQQASGWSKGEYLDRFGNYVKYPSEHLWAEFFKNSSSVPCAIFDFIEQHSLKLGADFHNALVKTSDGRILVILNNGQFASLHKQDISRQSCSSLITLSMLGTNGILVARGDSDRLLSRATLKRLHDGNYSLHLVNLDKYLALDSNGFHTFSENPELRSPELESDHRFILQFQQHFHPNFDEPHQDQLINSPITGTSYC